MRKDNRIVYQCSFGGPTSYSWENVNHVRIRVDRMDGHRWRLHYRIVRPQNRRLLLRNITAIHPPKENGPWLGCQPPPFSSDRAHPTLVEYASTRNPSRATGGPSVEGRVYSTLLVVARCENWPSRQRLLTPFTVVPFFDIVSTSTDTRRWYLWHTKN